MEGKGLAILVIVLVIFIIGLIAYCYYPCDKKDCDDKDGDCGKKKCGEKKCSGSERRNQIKLAVKDNQRAFSKGGAEERFRDKYDSEMPDPFLDGEIKK